MRPLQVGAIVAGCNLLLTVVCGLLALAGIGPLGSPVPRWVSQAAGLTAAVLIAPLGFLGSPWLIPVNSLLWGLAAGVAVAWRRRRPRVPESRDKNLR